MKLTKLIAALDAAVLTVALAVGASAADPMVVWDFANSDDTTLYNADGTMAFGVNQATAAYDAENACMTANITGGDPFFQLPSYGDFPAENSFVRVKYNLTGINDWSTSIYFTTDTVDWSETGHWKGFYDGDDDVWTEQTFYMTDCAAWAGTIKNMRLDIFDAGTEGQIAKVAYVAVFGSEEDANNFDYAAWKANGSPATLKAGAPAAGEPNETNVYKGTPVVDGKLDDIYLTSAKQVLGAPFHQWGSYVAGENDNMSAEAYFLWDDNYLYTCVVVTDPDVIDIGAECHRHRCGSL